jgi:hypothetical protein
MTQDIFEETLRQYLRRRPFFPFTVELLNGKVITVEKPTLAMGGGAATMLTPDQLIEFACEEVREIRPVPSETIS